MALGPLNMSANVRVRMNFAVLHLAAAASFARRTAQVEAEHSQDDFGPFFEDILASSSACVLLSVASLEAYANELFIDAERHFPNVPPGAMEAIWSFAERESVTDKFQLFLKLRGVEQLEKGSSPYQDVWALVKLRNALTHFQPEWDDEQGEHEKVSNALRGRFVPSSFVEGNEDLFPKRWAAHGCTAWAVQSCQDFVGEFSRHAGIADRFEKFRDRFAV